jgi:hypothetical protein
MDKYFKKKFEVQKKVLLIFVSVLAFLIFAYLAGDINWMGDILLFIELISSVLAIVVGALALVRFYTKKTKLSFLVLGIGFLLVGLLESIYIVSAMNGFGNLLNYSSNEMFPLNMVLSNGFLSVIFFISYLVRKDYNNENSKQEKGIALGIVSVFVILVSIFLLFTNILSGYQGYLPAVVGGLLSMLMAIISIFGYWKSNTWKYEAFEYWLLFALIFVLISNIFFLPILNLEYDLMIKFSVFARFMSYVLLLIGFLVSVYEMSMREQQYLESLRKKNELLLKSKNNIEEAYMLLRKEKWQIARGKGKVKDILKHAIEDED